MPFKPLVAITAGDPAGIGPEISLKALACASIYEKCRPLVIGSKASMLQAGKLVSGSRLRFIADPADADFSHGEINCLQVDLAYDSAWEMGKVSAAAGLAAYKSVEKSIGLAMSGQIDAVVTAPLNKESLHLAGFNFAGHTEIFRHLTGSSSAAMLLVSGNLRVIHVTTHMSMLDACAAITTGNVLRVIRLADMAMKLLGLKGKLAVAGLNAHCSESGLFGSEEAEAIKPAIEAAKKDGIAVEGPVPADTVFIKAAAGQYDMVVAMYHDQGHIPVKMHGFKADPATGEFTSIGGVNCTIGLPIIRTSVDHGTAFDLAGQGRASEQSLLDAIDMAIDMAVNSKSKK